MEQNPPHRSGDGVDEGLGDFDLIAERCYRDGSAVVVKRSDVEVERVVNVARVFDDDVGPWASDVVQDLVEILRTDQLTLYEGPRVAALHALWCLPPLPGEHTEMVRGRAH